MNCYEFNSTWIARFAATVSINATWVYTEPWTGYTYDANLIGSRTIMPDTAWGSYTDWTKRELTCFDAWYNRLVQLETLYKQWILRGKAPYNEMDPERGSPETCMGTAGLHGYIRQKIVTKNSGFQINFTSTTGSPTKLAVYPSPIVRWEDWADEDGRVCTANKLIWEDPESPIPYPVGSLEVMNMVPIGGFTARWRKDPLDNWESYATFHDRPSLMFGHLVNPGWTNTGNPYEVAQNPSRNSAAPFFTGSIDWSWDYDYGFIQIPEVTFSDFSFQPDSTATLEMNGSAVGTLQIAPYS